MSSNFFPETLPGFTVPSRAHYDFCILNYDNFKRPNEFHTANIIISGYLSNEVVDLVSICAADAMMLHYGLNPLNN